MPQSQHVDSARKITEKTEIARREFFKNVERLIRHYGHNNKLMQDVADQAAQDYSKVFGRIGVHPLLHLKGGRQAPRYIMDRDEAWVMYKPSLWQMGGNEASWTRRVEELVAEARSLEEAQEKLLKSDKMELLSVWHGVTQGKLYHDLDQPMENWGFIQRLDVETDGPVVVAKTWRSQRCLRAQMKEHIFTKAYICLVHGRLQNRIQHVRTKFGELGSDNHTQVMLKHDAEHDPLYEWSVSGRWTGRSVRMAESFFKPMAYYYRKEDDTEYSLVYVNIITGITHQVRITLQSVGHPLVSDDRYLPKDQAMSDLKWCPRNFLCEVRSDWFDLFGPHQDETRRRYTRISIENPLPRLLQNVLEQKLKLVEKLDPTADLFTGCQYWALGDEQLMNAFPKDAEYRRKVMRWGQRRGIHLDALDRLLLLAKEDIDDILNMYKLPDDTLNDMWVCPECMAFNSSASGSALQCMGTAAMDCPGTRVNDANKLLPKGWKNWLEDPTMNMLMVVSPRWLEARRKILKFSRPAWEKPHIEREGSPATSNVLLVLEAALVLNGKSGRCGIPEEELPNVPGLQDIKLPLAEPSEDSNVQRMRLPGRGTLSQWTYSLKGKEIIKYTQDYACKVKRLTMPVVVKSDLLPRKQVLLKGERAKREREMEVELQSVEEERESKEDVPTTHEEDMAKVAGPPAKKQKQRKWQEIESTGNPGTYYYFDAEPGDTCTQKPPDYEEPIAWERMESKTTPGEFYYYNHITGQSQVQRPNRVDIRSDYGAAKLTFKLKARLGNETDEDITWKRVESKCKPGQYYYFNSKTGVNEVHPPRVVPPWKLIESKTKRGQFFYFNEDTGENLLDPPPSARPAVRSTDPAACRGKEERVPQHWRRVESKTHKGKFYYVNSKTGDTSWTQPVVWEKKESTSSPGVFYWQNALTGETSWEAKYGRGREAGA